MAEMTLAERIEASLDTIRPAIQSHGGEIAVIDIDEDSNTLTVHLSGSCVGCPASILTLRIGVERAIFRDVPEIRFVEAV